MAWFDVGAGLAAAGESIAKTAGAMSLEALRAQLEEGRLKLASELAEGASSRGRVEAHGLDMAKQEASQAFQRPGEEARTRQANTGTDLALKGEAREAEGGKRLAASLGGGTAATASEDYQKRFIETVTPYAEEAARKTGVNPKLIIAQAALESDWGRAAPGNNYFGIKSHGQPGGQTLGTTEVVGGKTVGTKDSFRAYNSPAESFEDYAKFIASNSRYREVQSAKDLDSQIAAMGRSGYATDPQYAQKLGQITRMLGDGGGGGTSTYPAEVKAEAEALIAAGKTKDATDLLRQHRETQSKQNADPDVVRLMKGLEKATPEQWVAIKKYQDMQREPKATPGEMAGYEPDPNKPGALRPISGGPRDPAQVGQIEAAKEGAKTKTMNDEQSKAAGFSDRMMTSNRLLSTLDKEGSNAWGRFASAVPGGNFVKTDEYQKFEQAKRDFINAQLRRESGAVISKDEMTNADQQYFPQPGDAKAVIEQKAANRQLTLDGMIRSAGPTYRVPQVDAGRQVPADVTRRASSEAPKVLSLPSRQEDLVSGGRYQTPRGVFMWNGQMMVPE